MPYNIWCDGCKKHIGMGVRYNAENKGWNVLHHPSLSVSYEMSLVSKQDRDQDRPGQHGLHHHGGGQEGRTKVGSITEWTNCPRRQDHRQKVG